MENETHIIIRTFFRCMGIGFIILTLRVDIHNKSVVVIVKELFNLYAYCLTGMIFIGVSGMFTQIIYEEIKKNSLNESNYVTLFRQVHR